MEYGKALHWSLILVYSKIVFFMLERYQTFVLCLVAAIAGRLLQGFFVMFKGTVC